MEALDIEIDKAVVEFLRMAEGGLGLKDPVATLIYGRFSDESADHFRIAISERATLSVGPSGVGAIYRVSLLGELYTPNHLVESVRGKLLSLENDVVILRGRG